LSWQLIATDEELATLLSRAADCRTVIVDTEFMRRNTFYPQVALLQLCFDSGPAAEQAWLVDPLAISDTAPLVRLLSDPQVIKVLHSASEDLEVFQRWLGVLPDPLFDTQRAAALVDIGFGMGYRNLVQAICDVDLPKGETRSDWLQRPLTESQCDYAAQDVIWLLAVWRELRDRCREQDKLEWVLADGADATRTAMANGSGSYYPRIKSAWKLDRRQLGALKAVCEWREETARSRDKPRNWIIDDKACLQLALNDPASRSALRASVDLPPPAMRRYGETLLDLLAEQRKIPEEELPRRLPAPLNARQRDMLKKLKARVREIGAELGAAPEALLQSRDYELLVRSASGEPIAAPAHWQGWRRDEVVAPLRQLLGDRQ
jgi:ribonuclease D